jgi:hypothetical protein
MKVECFDNFFSEDLYDELVGTARSLLKTDSHSFISNAWWDKKIVRDSFPVLIHHIYKESELFKKCHQQIEEKTNFYVKGHDIMIYYWTRFSYIPWHDDGIYAAGLTVYLNEVWDHDYGGFFLYEEEKNDLRAIIPRKNLGLLQKGGTKHCTTPVNFDGGMRITIQTFLESK